MINKVISVSLLGLTAILLGSCASESKNSDVFNKEQAPTMVNLEQSHALSRIMLAKMPEKKYPIEVSYPYIITGNLPASELIKWKNKISATQASLKAMYFKSDPKKPIEVWLFSDAKSYYDFNYNLWQFHPSTPYGYYLPESRRMVMNIATGGGTLIHELVHPYIVENFPDSPPWINEGLASLYEKSSKQNSIIRGLSNWRLGTLKSAIKTNTMPTLKATFQTNWVEFYGVNHEIHYAQARYVMYYLQQRGLLTLYYHLLTNNITQDPSGINTLLNVTQSASIEIFEKQWLDFISNIN